MCFKYTGYLVEQILHLKHPFLIVRSLFSITKINRTFSSNTSDIKWALNAATYYNWYDAKTYACLRKCSYIPVR